MAPASLLDSTAELTLVSELAPSLLGHEVVWVPPPLTYLAQLGELVWDHEWVSGSCTLPGQHSGAGSDNEGTGEPAPSRLVLEKVDLLS